MFINALKHLYLHTQNKTKNVCAYKLPAAAFIYMCTKF